MAFVDRPTASLSYSLVDETGSKSQFSLDMPSDTLADVALTGAAALVPLVRAATGCTVLSYNVTYGARDVTPPAADAGSRVERKGTFQFLTAAGKIVTYNLPGIISAAVLPDGRIDDDHVAIAPLAGAIIAVDALFTDSNGVDLTALYAAYEKFARTTKGQLPSARRPD
jgi:hypothetical protein